LPSLFSLYLQSDGKVNGLQSDDPLLLQREGYDYINLQGIEPQKGKYTIAFLKLS
jgi:hypothetical protein